MDLKFVNLTIMCIFMFAQQLESIMKELPISFTQEQTVHLLEYKSNNFMYPDKIVKATDIHKTLHSNRFKRTSTTLIKNKDPQTPIDPLQIIHPVIKPEYGMLFGHQGHARLTKTIFTHSNQATKSNRFTTQSSFNAIL